MVALPSGISAFSKDIDFFGARDYIFAHYRQKKPCFRQQVCFEHNALIFVLEGEKRILTGSAEYSIQAKEAIFIPKNQYLLSEILDSSNNSYSSLLFFFPDTVIRDFIYKYHDLFHLDKTKQSVEFLIKTDTFLCSLFESFLALIKLKNQPQILSLKYEEIFLYLLEDPKNRENFIAFLSHFASLDFELFIDILPEKLSYENVSMMAKSAKMSQASFSRKFKEKLGVSPKEWLDNERFERARFLLEFSDKNITEISQDLGFNSPAWFIDRFKKRYGITPKQFQISKNLYFLSQN